MHATKRSIISVILMVLLLGALSSLAYLASPAPSLAATSGFNGKIAFSSSRDGNFEIYIMDGDGTNEERLTNNTANDQSPSWSPNGTKIAFARDNSIYTMDQDGKRLKKLLTFTHTPEDPVWSPDGKSILFSAVTDGTDRDIYVVSTEGGRAKEISRRAASDDFEATWSPDGKKVAFSSSTNGTDYDIYVMNSDGSNRTLIIEEGSNRHPSWSPDGTRLVFSSDRVRTYDIFTSDLDGGNVTRLTNNSTSESYPFWSPDGRRIVFTSSGEGHADQVYVMNSDGTKQQRLTKHQYKDLSPEFQPLKAPAKEELPILRENGRILFTTQRQGNSAEIYVMNADGGNATALVSSNDSEDRFPKWSPDGDKISFVSVKDGLEEIAIIDADGTNRVSLTLSTAPFAGSDWSPDGKKVVFAKGDPYHRWIHVINANGTDQWRLTRGNEPDSDPSWSPDGEKIAFTRDVGEGNSEIYIMDKDGTDQRKLTDHPGLDFYPQWSPEGDLIAFVSDRDGNEEIYVMNANGKIPKNLTNNTAVDLYPSWSPDGESIVFVSDRFEDSLDIHVMDANGNNVNRLTRDQSPESYPDFGPLKATDEILSEPPNGEEIEPFTRPLTVLTPVLKSQSSSSQGASAGEPLVVSAALTNSNLSAALETVAILEVRDSNGITRHIGLLQHTVSAGGRVELDFSWTPEEAGSYEILVFVIDNKQDPQLLADKTSSRISIVERK